MEEEVAVFDADHWYGLVGEWVGGGFVIGTFGGGRLRIWDLEWCGFLLLGNLDPLSVGRIRFIEIRNKNRRLSSSLQSANIGRLMTLPLRQC